MLAAHRDVAMQYSPNNIVFTISMVDAGTADLIRGLGKNIVSSADLIAQFEATWTDDQIKTHFEARDSIDAITAEAFKEIGRRVRNGGTTEHDIQNFFKEAFAAKTLSPTTSLSWPSTPTAAIRTTSPVPLIRTIREGDLSARCVGKKEQARRGLLRHHMGRRRRQVCHRTPAGNFRIVRGARDIGVKTVQDAVAAGKAIAGWQVDQAVRATSKRPVTATTSYTARPFHRHRGPLQRRQYGRPGNSRRAPHFAQLVLLH